MKLRIGSFSEIICIRSVWLCKTQRLLLSLVLLLWYSDLISFRWCMFPSSSHLIQPPVLDIVYCWPKAILHGLTLQCVETVVYSPLLHSVLLLLSQHLIHNTTLFLIRAFKFDLDLNPSRWRFGWKQGLDVGLKNPMISSPICSLSAHFSVLGAL